MRDRNAWNQAEFTRGWNRVVDDLRKAINPTLTAKSQLDALKANLVGGLTPNQYMSGLRAALEHYNEHGTIRSKVNHVAQETA